MTDSTGLTSRIYDQLNRVKMKKAQDNGFVRYYYDIIVEDTTEQGETVYLTAEVSRDPESNQTTKVNDKAGRLKYVYDGTITNGASISSLNRSKLITYEYYDNGARKSVLYPEFTKSGQTFRYEEVYEYHPDGMLDTLINRKVKVVNQGSPTVETVIEKYEYTYDEANNQTKKIEHLVGGTRITDYEYDALNRLETVSESNGRVTVYEYDVAGNRETEKISQSGTVQIFNTYVYDKQNRLERIETTGVETQIQSYRYDENGNQTEVYTVKGSTTEQTASYSYDSLSRMVSATVGGKTVTYTYSGDGLRVSKYVDGTLTKYIYEYDKVVLELDGSGNQVGRNIYGTNLLMRQADGLSLYYLYNGHADVTALVDANTGVLRATYYYDAFGNIEEEKYYDANGNLTTTPINNNIRYAGYQYDEETELYYLTARMYDPKIARFLQEDTYTGSPDDPLSLNLYVYCGNNPLVYYDPTGHFRIFGVEFGNPIEGFKELFLTTEEEREQNFRIIYLYGGDDAYTTFVTDMGAALVEVGDLFKDPISQMNENNAILDSFLSNDLGLKDSKVYNTAKEALESDIKKVEAAAIYSINMFKSVAQTGYVIIDSNNKQMNFAYDTLGLLTGGSNFESWGNSAQDYYNHQRMLVSIPGNIVTGAVNDVRTLLNPKNAGNYFFNPDASLESIVEYQSAGFDTAMWVIPTAKVAPKIKTRITSTLGSISEKGIKGFVSDIKNGIKLKVGKKGTRSTAQQLQEIANKANQTVPGQGTVPGTLKHSEFAKQVKELNNPLLQAEVTYKNGQLVTYGTKGGVRLDVVEYNVDGTIKAVYDLKTGKAGLTNSRIQEILNHLPNNAPVYEIRP